MDNLATRTTENQNFNPHQPPNYMSYALGGSYDENQYAQYAPGDYNMNSQGFDGKPQIGFAVKPQMTQPSMEQNGSARSPPKTFTDTHGGRAPDTQSAIRPTSSRDWRVGSALPDQQPNTRARFQSEQKDLYHPAFEVVGGSERSVPSSARASYYSCPACGELAVKVSDNMNRDASCRNGHRWQLVQK